MKDQNDKDNKKDQKDKIVKSCKAFFFDLDGVLIHSLPDIAAAVNISLAANGYQPLTEDQTARYVGNGARHLLMAAFSAAASLASKTPPDFTGDAYGAIFKQFLLDYKLCSVQRSALYPSVRELLQALQAQNIPMAVVSNKPYDVACAAVRKLEIDHYFDCVVCPEQVNHPKPHPEPLEYALKHINAGRQSQLCPRDILMTGDSAGDIQAGKAFGAFTCAITGGYGAKADLLAQNADIVVEKAGELLAAITQC
jgi:phosphoglycolate phosphatase